MKIYAVEERTNALLDQLTHVWEQSVKATHLFLSAAEIAEIKPYLPKVLLEIPGLIIAENEDGFPVGFMGIENRKLEMLFISPAERGKGIGTEAIKFVASYFKDWKQFTLITPIDKKENIKFYTEKCGFKIISTEMDGNVKVVRFILEKEN